LGLAAAGYADGPLVRTGLAALAGLHRDPARAAARVLVLHILAAVLGLAAGGGAAVGAGGLGRARVRRPAPGRAILPSGGVGRRLLRRLPGGRGTLLLLLLLGGLLQRLAGSLARLLVLGVAGQPLQPVERLALALFVSLLQLLLLSGHVLGLRVLAGL